MLGAGCKREERAPVIPPPPTAAPDHPVAPAATVEQPPSAGPTLSREERRALPGLIAFVREVGGRKVPHLVRPDGTSLRPLPGPAGIDAVVMAASRDGRHLAGVAAVGEGEDHVEQLVVWTLPAGELRETGPRSRRARSPAFSPDGAVIAFESGHERFSNLYLVAPDGSGLRPVTDAEAGDFDPTWSHDGAWLAFASSREGDPEIFRVRPDGSGADRLTAFHREDVSPRFSPAGAELAFLSDREGEDALYLMSADGTRQRRVGPAGAAREHAWSPDGLSLALVIRDEARRTRIAVIDARSGAARFVTSGQAVDDMPAWSPDGRHLVFVSDRAGAPQLYLARADGSGVTALLDSPGRDWLPVWVPAAR